MKSRKKRSHSLTIFGSSWMLPLGFFSGASTAFLYDELWTKPPIIYSNEDMQVQACFTPGQKCQMLLLQHLESAQNSIFVMAYYLTAEPIIDALIEAHDRGVLVHILVDKTQVGKSPYLKKIIGAGIPVMNDSKVAIAHNKTMIIDGKTLVTGSYNFTDAAEYRNAENLLIIHNSDLAAVYQVNWQKRFDVSQSVPIS